MNHRKSWITLFVLLALAWPARAANDIEFADFEGESFGGWQTQGDAFGAGPVRDETIVQLEIQKQHGNGLASSEREGDRPTGTLTSPEFKITHRYISFLIGGGAHEHYTTLNLVIGGKIVHSTPGWNSDRLMPVTWDVSQWKNQTAQLQMVDNARGDWGHINVDHIVFTDNPEHLPPPAQPLYQEAHRPQFHFTARQWTTNRLNPQRRQEGWLNDLNGLIYYEGEYHLFAQRWAKCWIHAVSRDLIHWTELEPAFWEEEEGSGVQSGTCVIDYANTSGLSPDKNNPPMVAFWSRFDNRSQCLSYSLDKGRTWKHYEKNPLFIFPERDPKVFWHEPTKKWVMMMYGNDKYHILTSPNLLDWTDEKQPINNSFECPDFFEMPLDGDPNQKRWVLIRGDGKYSIGSFDGKKFTEESALFESDGGPHFYATQTWENTQTGDGRRIQVAWMREGHYPDMPFNQQITFPRELTLRSTPNGPRIFRNPVGEINKLHKNEDSWTNVSLRAGQPLPLKSSGDLFHIKATLSIPQGASLTFHIRGVTLEIKHQTIASGTRPLAVAGEIKNIEVLIDRTSLEAFANNGEVSLSRCYLPTESGLSLRAHGGPVTIQSLQVWELNSIWQNQTIQTIK